MKNSYKKSKYEDPECRYYRDGVSTCFTYYFFKDNALKFLATSQIIYLSESKSGDKVLKRHLMERLYD